MSEAKGPDLTMELRVRRHGATYLEVEHAILADGKPTGFVHYERTDGPPAFRYTHAEIRGHGEVLDLLGRDGPDPREWVLARLTPAVEVPHG